MFGFLTSAMGAGAVAGGLVVATVGITGLAPLTAAALAFGLAILAAAAVATLATELIALVVVGATSTALMATGNSTLQLTSDPRFRGRVMALWAVTFQGSTPIGGPIIGAVSEYTTPGSALRWARSRACSPPRSEAPRCAGSRPASVARRTPCGWTGARTSRLTAANGIQADQDSERGVISTGHCARRRTACETLPTNVRRTGPYPREPITSRSASTASPRIDSAGSAPTRIS